MSLALREECQPIINEFFMGDFHAMIDSNKKLKIAHECGKPLFTVRDIEFSKTVPTRKEIEYAAKLLEKFLISHEKTVNNYLTQIDKVSKLKLITNTTNYNVISNMHTKKGHITYTDSVFSITLCNKNIWTEKIIINSTVRLTEVLTTDDFFASRNKTSFSLDKKLYKEMVKILIKYISQQVEISKVQKYKQDLETCNI